MMISAAPQIAPSLQNHASHDFEAMRVVCTIIPRSGSRQAIRTTYGHSSALLSLRMKGGSVSGYI